MMAALSGANPSTSIPKTCIVPARSLTERRGYFYSSVEIGRRTTPSTSLPNPAASPRAAAGPGDWRIAASAVSLVLVASVLMWSALAFKGVDENRPGSSPHCAAGAQVRLSVPGETSTSLLRGCPTGLWLGVVGVASDGQTARVLDRRGCSGKWCYQVVVAEAANSDWDGVGWVDGTYLTPR